MADDARHFTVVITRWDGQWEAFVLEDAVGYLGTVHAAELEDVDSAVRTLLTQLFGEPAVQFQLRTLRH